MLGVETLHPMASVVKSRFFKKETGMSPQVYRLNIA